MADQDQTTDIVNNAVAEGGAYEIIRKRLVEQGKQLSDKTGKLNETRLSEFGNSAMEIIGRVRVRTENNCIARDIVQVGDLLLFGYNVFIGLKKETRIEDVFALFKLTETQDGYELQPFSIAQSFLNASAFKNDFDELYRYYKHTHLVQLKVAHGKLLAGFQIGERVEDIRVFRWSISADGKQISYLDNRGERDIELPPSYDFEWTATHRENYINGRHPHVNILDAVFVETVGGDLTVKIEDNTEDGFGIYREPVEDKTQSLDDAEIHYAAVGGLILLKIKPYREDQWRYLVFNTLTKQVQRIDALSQSCQQLPEDHGIIFPGGYYLQTGEYKIYDDKYDGLKFRRVIKSPNGEDVLYVFYQNEEGIIGLLSYNLISKSLRNPIYGHGYALSDDGKIVVFSAENEATRIHPMQIWQTPFFSDVHASQKQVSQNFFGKIGNPELVRGISDLYAICRMIDDQQASMRLYEELNAAALKVFDAHYWLAENEMKEVEALLKEIAKTADLVIDEFAKVQSIRQQSDKTMQQAVQDQEQLLQSIRPDNWESAEDYVQTLANLRRQRGHLTSIREYRYIDLVQIDTLDTELLQAEESLGQQTVAFLSSEQALQPYLDKVAEIDSEVEKANTHAELSPLIETIAGVAEGLDLLSELMSTLTVEDATLRTRIIDAITEVYAKLNRSEANAKRKQQGLGLEEAIAQFSAQFKLFSQSITNALSQADTPERCDEQLSRLLVQLEELESQFSGYDQFLGDIMDKREEIYEAFEKHKQQLTDELQRKAQSIFDAAERILANIEKRSLKFTETDELNTYFASDALVLKIRELVVKLRGMDSAVKADDIESRFKAIKEQALRSLRDKTDIFEDGGNIIKLGPKHKFSVNTQVLDLTILPRNDELYIHLTGTDFFERLDNSELTALKKFWEMSLESETDSVYRAEYLAVSIIKSAEQNQHGLTMDSLNSALKNDEELSKIIRTYATPRYKEGYIKGVHDYDGGLILKQVLPVLQSADLLRYAPLSRALAQFFWVNINTLSPSREQAKPPYETWVERAQSASHMQSEFASIQAAQLLASEIRSAITAFFQQHPLDIAGHIVDRAADYLVAELGRERLEFIGSKYAQNLADELKRTLSDNSWRQFRASLDKLTDWPAERWRLTQAWLQELISHKSLQHYERYIPEAITLLNGNSVSRRFTQTDLEITVSGLLGEHPMVSNQTLSFALDDFLQRMEHHQSVVIPAYHRYLQVRQEVITKEREVLRLESFKPSPLSSFVRNRLINEAYLPIIGDNLAKQMGTVGENKRTDLMGLLMMISPPGYGKTTLMEYVANRLGLIFMKINCPSLGHEVKSLDPSQAPNATARQELEKINLAFEMGNNVMLYLDDIQHTHPEFLQKYISLCDGTRRVEGVWKGKTKTYDMRGKKFCVVMAGNPYTESGEVFKIPDMLANRADIYNLGDILGGMQEQFALSYIENSLTSNPVLAPLAVRDMQDVYNLVRMARGENIATTELRYQYSGAEINEITEVLRKLFVIQEVVLKINQQYISSASQDDKYRTEPPFKLQGSYRNMNKMAEKVSSVMNEQELMQLISDHYQGEAQMLTSGAESNLLKLAELQGNMTTEQQKRWQQINEDFIRNKVMGGEGDTGGKLVGQMVDLVKGIKALENTFKNAAETQSKAHSTSLEENNRKIYRVTEALENLSTSLSSNRANVEVINQPVPGMDKVLHVLAKTLEKSILPLVINMDKKLEIDQNTLYQINEVIDEIKKVQHLVAHK